MSVSQCKSCRQNKELADKYEDRYFCARALLSEIVSQYESSPDGPLGRGFTNKIFLDAKKFLLCGVTNKP